MSIDQWIARLETGDNASHIIGRFGLVSSIVGTGGWYSTADVTWLVGVIFGLATVTVQVIWEWHKRRKFAWIEVEMYKARKRMEASQTGLDVTTIRALQESPDPDKD